MSKWNLDEFVEVLNKEVPLSSLEERGVSDRRRSDVWTARMVRTYFSKGDLTSPVKDGKYRFYNENHLEEFKSLIGLQYSGVSYKTANSLLKSSYESTAICNSLNISGSLNDNNMNFCSPSTGFQNQSYKDKKDKANEILRNIGNLTSSSILKSQSENENKKYWIKEQVVDGLEINIRKDIFDNKEMLNNLLKNWLINNK